ncbi:DUF2226 domain-containing protein [Archaeoglobus sp.]
MILPKGNLVEILRGKPIDYFDRVKYGYLTVSWKEGGEIYSASVLIKNGEPVMAELELIKSRKTLRGLEALREVEKVDYAVVEVYSLSAEDVNKAITMNDETLVVAHITERKLETQEQKAEEPAKPVKSELHESEEESEKEVGVTENFEEHILREFKGFTGIIKGIGNDRVATIYMKNGKLVGAKVSIGNETYEGLSALYYLEFPAKVVVKELNDVQVDENCKVDAERLRVNKSELLKKLKINVSEEEVEKVVRVLEELSSEEPKGWKRFFKRRKK